MLRADFKIPIETPISGSRGAFGEGNPERRAVA
jgi:hypothetical protein